MEALTDGGMRHGKSACLSCAGALATGGGAPARQLLQFGAPEQLLAALEKVQARTRLIKVISDAAACGVS